MSPSVCAIPLTLESVQEHSLQVESFGEEKKKVMNFSSMLSDHVVQMVPYTFSGWLQNTNLRSFFKSKLGVSLKRMMAQKLTNLQPQKVNTMMSCSAKF